MLPESWRVRCDAREVADGDLACRIRAGEPKPGSRSAKRLSQLIFPWPTSEARTVEASGLDTEARSKTVSGSICAGFSNLANAVAAEKDDLVVIDDGHCCSGNLRFFYGLSEVGIESRRADRMLSAETAGLSWAEQKSGRQQTTTRQCDCEMHLENRPISGSALYTHSIESSMISCRL